MTHPSQIPGKENPYEHLMNKQRPVHDGDDFSVRHPKMPLKKRAHLFAPFDALRGFDAALLAKEQEKSLPT